MRTAVKRPFSFLLVSIILHALLFMGAVWEISWQKPLAVFEKTHKNDVISIVLLGERKDSLLLIHTKKMTVNTVKPNILNHRAPVSKKEFPLQIKKKVTTKARNLFAKDLLVDMEKQMQEKNPKSHLKSKFEKPLHEQAEESLSQHLLNEEVRLTAKRSREARGEINKYQALILQAISESWIVPIGANKKLMSELMIRVAPSGSVLGVDIIKSSGNPALDRSARSAVLKASPLPVPKDKIAFAAFKQFVLKVKPENILNGESS